MKNSKDVEAWLLGMKKLLRFHSYSKKMKAKISTLSLREKVDIWWKEELNWDDFERLFKKKYMLKRHYDGRAKEFSKLQMVSMTNDEYSSRFLELLRYIPYLKDEKAKIHRFIIGLPTTYRDFIEFDTIRSFEETIQKLNHCYDNSKGESDPKHYLKGNDKVKGK